MIRSMLARVAGFLAVSLAAVPPAAIAQSADGGDTEFQRQLQTMQQEIEKLRQENQAMRGEIDELRVKTDADWLTQARADEIRSLVADVMADADTRASLLNNGLAAGWSEHFFLASLDGRFKLVLDGMMQIRWIYNFRDEPDRHVQGFENTRTRLTFSGHVFDDDIEYLIRSDFARSGGGASLLDAWIRYSFTDEWSVRIGQFKLPFNREELVSPAHQLGVERSLINESQNLGRSQGIELAFHDSLNRFSLAVSDGASPSNWLAANGVLYDTAFSIPSGPRTNTPAINPDVEYAVTARYERLAAGNWEQFNDFTSPRGEEFGMLWGLAVHAQESEHPQTFAFFDPGQRTNRFWGATVDLSLEWGGANAFVSATYHYVDTAPASPFATNFGLLKYIGIMAQVGVYVTNKTELFLRGEYGQLDGQSGSFVNVSDLNLVTAGVNYYIDGHDLKWTTDIGFGVSKIEGGVFATDLVGYRGEATAESRPQVVFRTQFQLLF